MISVFSPVVQRALRDARLLQAQADRITEEAGFIIMGLLENLDPTELSDEELFALVNGLPAGAHKTQLMQTLRRRNT
jgi:hypothetical protein